MTMKLLKGRPFLVFVALLGITGLTYFSSHGSLLEGRALGATLLALAFFKVRLIVIHYMEAPEAHPAIRLAFEAWLVGAAATTIALYLR